MLLIPKNNVREIWDDLVYRNSWQEILDLIEPRIGVATGDEEKIVKIIKQKAQDMIDQNRNFPKTSDELFEILNS